MIDENGNLVWNLGEETYTIEPAIQTNKPRELVAVDKEKSILYKYGVMGPKFVASPESIV